MDNNEEDLEKKLIERIIKEQDLVTLYIYDFSSIVSVTFSENFNDEPKLSYFKLKDYIMEHMEIIDEFSIKNLYTLLANFKDSSKDKEIYDRINSCISKKMEKEDFYCENISTEIFLKSFNSYNKYSIISEENREKIKNQVVSDINDIKDPKYQKIINNINYIPDAANFLKYYKQGIFDSEKIEVINQMIDKTDNALQFVNFGLFEDEIFKIGPDFCMYLSKFPSLSYQLVTINENNPELMRVLASRFTQYTDLKENLNEIQLLIKYSAKNLWKFKDKEINIDDYLECAYRNMNGYNSIQEHVNVEYGENYWERLDDKLTFEYNNSGITEKKLNIYLNKQYSMSLTSAKKMLTEFGEDLSNLPDISEETISFFNELKRVVELDDPKLIDELFLNSTFKYKSNEIEKMKNEVAKLCAKTFSVEFKNTSNTLEKSEDSKQIEYNGKSIKIINLHGEFNMLTHSSSANFVNITQKTEDFKHSWGHGDDKKNHIISTTYMTQNFMGTAPVGENGVRYAFVPDTPDCIKLMGVSDINTYSNSFAYNSATKQYMSAKTLPNNYRRVYGEIGIERENTNPDYIIVMDDDLPEVVQNSYKAANQFNIPIIYIDKSEIKNNQITNLKKLIEMYRNTNDLEILHNIINTYETNMAGWLLNRNDEISKDESHTASIDNTRFSEDFKQIQTEIEDLIKETLENNTGKRDSDKTIYKVIDILLSEIELYKGCEDTKPISSTHITLNTQELFEVANKAIRDTGNSEFQIEPERVYDVKYQKGIKEYIKEALGGNNYVDIEDVRIAEMFLEEASKEKMTEKGVDYKRL